jgi:hypothetical protein
VSRFRLGIVVNRFSHEILGRLELKCRINFDSLIDTIRLKTALVLYGKFLTHFAMDPLVIETVVAVAKVARLVAVEVAQNLAKISRNGSKSSKRGKRFLLRLLPIRPFFATTWVS